MVVKYIYNIDEISYQISIVNYVCSKVDFITMEVLSFKLQTWWENMPIVSKKTSGFPWTIASSTLCNQNFRKGRNFLAKRPTWSRLR